MNVLFIYSAKDAFSSKKPLKSQQEMHFGISYISSCLQKHGHKTRLLVITQETSARSIDSVLQEYLPALVCVTAVFSEYESILGVARYIKRHYPKIFVLAGGPHISLNPEESMAECFDAICVGEGEEATVELAKQLEENREPSHILNLWLRHANGIEKNPPRPFNEDLDTFPFPDRAMWQDWIEKPNTFYAILGSRGCPFLCTYCSNHALSKVSPGTYVRLRSPENIIAEIKDITATAPSVREFYFEIETLGAKLKWALDLCAQLESYNATLLTPLSYGTNVRVTPNLDLERLFQAMHRANFKFVNFGLESGSERVRREILNRRYSNEDILKATKLAKQYGLQVTFQIMIGMPGETPEDFQETIRITRECQPDHHYLYIFFPYPGTELHRVAKERGLLYQPLETELERRRAALDLPEFPREQVLSNYVWFEYNVRKGWKPLYKILATVLVAKINTSPRIFHFLRTLLRNSPLRVLRNGQKKIVEEERFQ